MATQAGEIEVKLTLKATDFQKALGQSKEQMSNFGDSAKSFIGELGKIFTFTEIAKFFKDSIEAFGEQEAASTKLVRALENQGRATDATVSHLEGFATSLSRVTATNDEVIISAQGTLVSFGLQGEALDKATKAALDMSVAMGIDLGSAATLLGKAFQGNTGQLSRYGIEINKNIEPTKRFSAVLGEVNGRFGGAATAQAQTFIGQVKQLGVSFNEFQESIGKLITGESGGILKFLNDIADRVNSAMSVIINARAQFNSLGDFLKTFAVSILGTMVLTITTLIQKILEIESHIPIIGKLYGTMATAVKTANGWLEDQIVKIQAVKLQSAEATGVMVTNEQTKVKQYHNTYTEWVAITDQQTLYTKDKLAEEVKMRSDQAETLKKAQQDFVMNFVTTQAQMWQAAGDFANHFIDGMGQGFAEMIVQGKSFGDSMKALFQDLAMEIIQWIIKMIIKMLIFLALRQAAESFGPVGAAVSNAMAVVGSSGALTSMAASGGMIKEPSIITGLRSGSKTLAGEAGAEAIVPMNSANAGVGGGGGGVNITIQGQFIEGDPASWQKLINEKIVPAIRRFTMATPTGPFTRRRGVA
jgi:hypothetical protein